MRLAGKQRTIEVTWRPSRETLGHGVSAKFRCDLDELRRWNDVVVVRGSVQRPVEYRRPVAHHPEQHRDGHVRESIFDARFYDPVICWFHGEQRGGVDKLRGEQRGDVDKLRGEQRGDVAVINLARPFHGKWHQLIVIDGGVSFWPVVAQWCAARVCPHREFVLAECGDPRG